MRSQANNHVKKARVSRYKYTVESRSFRAETKSKPACSYRHGARQKSGILKISTPIFLTPPQEQA